MIKYFILILSLLFIACNKDDWESHYSSVTEIDLPTNAPMGLAYDGEYLWYSDYELHTINKISATGEILETLNLSNCYVIGFDFHDGYIWCINDTTVYSDAFEDPDLYNYDHCCIYKLLITGVVLDSILLTELSYKPEYLGLTVSDTALFVSSDQGWSSSLYKINFEEKIKNQIDYFNFAGLTMHIDTLFAIDKSYSYHDRIVYFNSEFEIVKPKAIDIYFTASDIAFADNDLWACDVDNNKLIKVASR